MPTRRYKLKQMRSVWLTIIFGLGLAIPAYAGVIFTEDYEVADMTALQAKGWQLGCSSSPCTTDIVTSPVHGGSKALRMTYAGSHALPGGGFDDSHNSLIKKYFPGMTEVYERYYVRYDAIDPGQPSGFSTASAKQHFFNAGAPAPAVISNYMWGDPRYIFGVNHTTSVTCPNGSVDITCNYPQNGASITMTPGVYWCVETHLKMNTPSASDGILEVWINGTQTANYTNLKFRDPATPSATFNSIQVYRQGSDNMYRYEDDYVLATTRIGCSGNPSVDSTPPSTPVGLFVR